MQYKPRRERFSSLRGFGHPEKSKSVFKAHQVYSLPERSVFGWFLLLYLYKLIKGTALILGECFDDLHHISQFFDIVAGQIFLNLFLKFLP